MRSCPKFKTMKWCRHSVILLLFTMLAGAIHAESYLGWHREQLEGVLGKAAGVIEMGEATVLMFERGDVTMRGGVVVEQNIMSEHEHRAYVEARMHAKKRWQEILQRRKTIMHERALDLKRSKLNDPDFLALPLDEQIAFWGSFKAANPEISIEPHYTQLLQRYQDFLDQQRVKQLQAEYSERIASAEERVADAEARAARAEREAARARNTFYYYTPPTFYPTYPSVYFMPRRQRPILEIHYQKDDLGVHFNSGGLQQPGTPGILQ